MRQPVAAAKSQNVTWRPSLYISSESEVNERNAMLHKQFLGAITS